MGFSVYYRSTRPVSPAKVDAIEQAADNLCDLLDILCQLSREHRIDWEISHDYSDGPIGYIRGGVCDDAVLTQIEAFADLGDVLGDLMGDSEAQQPAFPLSAFGDSERDMDEDDDDGPSILSFRPKGE
jgi:hypothetical protein